MRKAAFWCAAAALGLLGAYFYSERLYVAFSYVVWSGFFLAAVAAFRLRKLTAEEAVLIASLAAIAAVGRVIFAPIPSVQPVSFIIICTGVVFGWRTALLTGLLATMVSNMFLGQGPWTLWQMLAWGTMGVFSGILFNSLRLRGKGAKILFGFAAGVLFGWIMNLWYLVSYIKAVSLPGILLAYSASIYMDLMHGLANAFFIAAFSGPLEKTLARVKTKYGVAADGTTRTISKEVNEYP